MPPGATGNIATEDLVSMLDEMGIATGVDAARAARSRLARRRTVLGRPLGSHTLDRRADRLPARSGERPMFERVLIANRGEIAVRIARHAARGSG